MPRTISTLILAIGWSSTAIAAQTFTVPLSVVPGSVLVGISTEPNTPAAMPFSVFLQAPNCSGAGTFSAEVVNGGLEVAFDGSAFATSGACQFTARATMELEFHVPEVGGTATMVRLEAVPITGSFSSISFVQADFVSRDPGSSSSVPGSFSTEGFSSTISWNQSGFGYHGNSTTLRAWIPGDTVRFPVEVSDFFSANPGLPTQGTVRVRYVFKVTVPEPSASLSLPLGVACLAGMSRVRGGT